MQLTWAENVVRHTDGGRVLILTPLAVGAQTVREGDKFGIEAYQSRDGKWPDGKHIIVTNYEKLHLFEPGDFSAVVCDESSILKHYTGATQKTVTRFMAKTPYRLLCTATAAPNDYTELGTSSEALGELTNSEMLTRFFKYLDDKGQKKELRNQSEDEKSGQYYGKLSFRVAQTIGQWRLKHHAVQSFWRWVASWARACRMPSDIGFNDGRFLLPQLIERSHVITPQTPPDGLLFCVPAFGLGEERDERKRTLTDRCEFAAQLAKHDKPVVVWCHTNDEGDTLENMIPNSIQIAGKHSDDYKEMAAKWFAGEICICNSDMFRAKLATWKQNQNDRTGTGLSIIENIVNNAWKNLRITASNTGEKKGNTLQGITKTTKKNTNEHQSKTPSATGSEEKNTQATKRLEHTKKKRPEITGLDARLLALVEQCESMDQALMSICDYLSLDAQSAGEKNQVISAGIACISTMIMQPENSEACCAARVILGSENYKTVKNCLKTQSCICGHQSGNRKLVTKSKIFGWGVNWQHCNHVITFASHSYEQYYQSVRRCWRFGQQNPVTVDVIATEGEKRVIENMQKKAARAELMFTALVKEMNAAQKVTIKNEYTKEQELPSWL